MKHPEIIRSICFVGLVYLLCRYSDFIVKSFSDGLQLWYNDLVPVLLPFLLLSGLFLSMLDMEHPKKYICILLIFLCGLCCGYPIGAIVIWNMYAHRVISRKFACSILPLCNNVSPMFLVGYVFRPYLSDYISLRLCICAIYLPQIAYAVCYVLFSYALHKKQNQPFIPVRSYRKELAAAGTDTGVICDSVRTITVIGIYIAVFSVLFDTVITLAPSSPAVSAAACFLEITKGIQRLFSLPVSAAKKTALCLSLTAFGGVSSLFQSMHVLKNTDLSFCGYICGKTICAIMTFVCAYYLFL